MRLWRKGKRIRFHLAQQGVVLPLSVEGYLLDKRHGHYVLTDAKTLTRAIDSNTGRVEIIEAPVDGLYEIAAALVIGREVKSG